MPAGARRQTLADTLAARRRFVGRETERSLFAAALDAADPDFRVLFTHGPGGIGKSALTRQWEGAATAAGRPVIRIDARDVGTSAEAVLAALAVELGALDEVDTLAALPESVVLILDTYELLDPIDRWVRTVVVPALPADGFLVLAGRARPHHGWRDDDGLAAITQVVSMRNLAPEESEELIAPVVADPALRAVLTERSHGHPLGLSVLADVHRQGGDLSDAAWRPDLLETLVSTFLDSAPGPVHRRALDALAIARVTTEASLRYVLADAADQADIGEVFTWLRGLSFVETGPDGLFPHDLARDALAADFRWRDPVGLRTVVKATMEYAVAQVLGTSGVAMQRYIMDVQHVFRAVPVLRDGWDWASFGMMRTEPATEADKAVVLPWVESWEGPVAAATAAAWWDRQPERALIVRDTFGEPRGLLQSIDLNQAAAADIAADPVAAAAWEHMQRVRPPAAGETALLMRGIDRDSHNAQGCGSNMGTVVLSQGPFLDPTLGWSFVALGEPEAWRDVCAFCGWGDFGGSAPSGSYTVHLWAHDFVSMPADRWLDGLVGRVADAYLNPDSEPRAPAVVALSFKEFSTAVKDGLRQLHRPDRLTVNPLSRSRIAHDASELASALRDAVAELRGSARTEKLFRALDRTYLRPAPTQEAAAEILDLPFSTYRRHLTTGIEHVSAALWHRELYDDGR